MDSQDLLVNYRALGRSGREVSPICLGGNVFGWTADEATSFSLFDASVDASMNFVDTADVDSRWVPGHTGGGSETILGKWLKQSGKRDEIVLATLVGKAQPLYNLMEQPAHEVELETVCVANGLGVIKFFPLASGLSRGKYRSEADLGKSARGQGFGKYLTSKGRRVLDTLDALAQRLNASPAQVALAWQITRPGITSPIAHATLLAQLESLVTAARLTLDADAIRSIDTASA